MASLNSTMEYDAFKALSMRLMQDPDFQQIQKETFQPYIRHLSQIVQSLTAEKNDLKTQVNDLKAQVSDLHGKINKVVNKAEILETKVTTQVNQEKNKNLRISGLVESTAEKTSEQVQNFIKENMKVVIPLSDFQAERVGLKKVSSVDQSSKPRPILVKFNNVWSRREILRQKKMLKDLNLNVFITEDLTREASNLFYQARQLRKEGKIAATFPRNGVIMYKKELQSKPEKLTPELLEQIKKNILLDSHNSSTETVNSNNSDNSTIDLSDRMNLRSSSDMSTSSK